VVALLVAVAALFAVVQLTDDGDPGGAGVETAADEPTTKPDPTRPDSPTQEPTDSAPAEEQSESGSGDGQGAASGGEAVAFVDGYFDTVPDDVDAGWAMLSPAYQAETGRESYDGFWAGVADADATDLSPAAGGDAVEATVTYEYEDGRTVEERQLLQLVPGEDGELRIDGYEQV
jgi:hypothetical protein